MQVHPGVWGAGADAGHRHQPQPHPHPPGLPGVATTRLTFPPAHQLRQLGPREGVRGGEAGAGGGLPNNTHRHLYLHVQVPTRY